MIRQLEKTHFALLNRFLHGLFEKSRFARAKISRNKKAQSDGRNGLEGEAKSRFARGRVFRNCSVESDCLCSLLGRKARFPWASSGSAGLHQRKTAPNPETLGPCTSEETCDETVQTIACLLPRGVGTIMPHRRARIEAPLSEDRGFTLTVRQLFQGAKPPERHRPYKVCAADLFPVPPCCFVSPEASFDTSGSLQGS